MFTENSLTYLEALTTLRMDKIVFDSLHCEDKIMHSLLCIHFFQKCSVRKNMLASYANFQHFFNYLIDLYRKPSIL